MVEQRPSKPHVWVRFLLSLYMLFKKPSIFVFKKKLNVLNSTQTSYVKHFKINSFNDNQQINFTFANLDDNRLTSFNQSWKNKMTFFRKTLFQKWNLKRSFKMKFFSRSLINTLRYSNQLNSLKNAHNVSFFWQTKTFHLLNTDFTFNPQFLNTNEFTYTHPHTNIILTQKHSQHFWAHLLKNAYLLSKLSLLNTTLFKQLHKYIHVNHNLTQLSSIHFMHINRHNLHITYKPCWGDLKPLIETSETITNQRKPLLKTTSLLHIVSILSKYLPHINLVRLFRRTRNKKTLNYNIDKNSFFKSTLLRINLDYKFYSLNTLKIHYTNKRKLNPISLFIRTLSRDNLLEMKFDSWIHNETSDTTFTPFYNSMNYKNKLTSLDNLNNRNFLIKISNNDLLTFDFLNMSTIINQPLLYKYIFWLIIPHNNLNNSLNHSLNSLNNHSFSTRINLFKTTNLWPSSFFHFTLKRKILKIFSFNKFLPNVTMWYYNILIRFMESCTGKKIFLKFNPFIENFLSFTDIARCNMWSIRINSFQKLLGPKIFLNESLRIMHIALRFKDPTFFANWIKGMLNRMSFWKYRLLFRYIKFAMRYLFWLYFSELQFKGLKIKLKGKISVAGNARTRTLVYRIGETGYSKIDNRVLCDSSIINTFTGVLGFKIWFFF